MTLMRRKAESEDESDEDEDIESTSLNDIPGEVRMALVIRSRSWHDKGQNSRHNAVTQHCHVLDILLQTPRVLHTTQL